MTVRRSVLLFLLFVVSSPSATAQSYRGQDAAVGGLAGAILGGIIGHQNDETPEGALIGGAVGAIAGGLIGDAKDQQVRYERHLQQQAWATRQRQVSRAVSIDDVVTMSRSGLSDLVIINHIRSNGIVDPVGTREIITMHNNGVRENVISAMQRARLVGESAIVPSRPFVPPVVIRKEVHVAGPRYVAPYRIRYSARPPFPPQPRHTLYCPIW